MNLQDKLVTVALPVYNGQDFLREALTSVVNQTHENLEIIIFNDGSTDNTLDIIKSFSDPRIIVISSTRNYDLATGLQVVKTLATGDYFAGISHDDIYTPDRVECLLGHAVMHNADVTFDVMQLMNHDGELMDAFFRMPDKIAKERHFTRLFERNRVGNPFFSKKCYKSIDFDLTLMYDEEYDFYLKCVCDGYTFLSVDEIKYYYRQNRNPSTKSVKHKKGRPAQKKILMKYPIQDIIQLYQKRGFSEFNINYMLCLQHIFRDDYKNALLYAQKQWPIEDDVCQEFYLGTLFLRNNKFALAETHLVNHLSKNPESPAGHNNMGVLSRLTNKDGTLFLKKAIDLFPPYMDANDNMKNPQSLIVTDTQMEVISDVKNGFYRTY